MADSTTNLDAIAVGQADKEDTANELFDAASPAMLYGRHASECSGLIWGYYGGRYLSLPIDNDTLTLTAASTLYIVAARVDGVVSFSASSVNWDLETDYIRLYKVVTGASTVTSYEDHRFVYGLGAGAVSAGVGGGGFGTLTGYEWTFTEIDTAPTSLDY
jgi:hypothetical protein